MTKELRIVGMVCNWGAYAALELAGVNGRSYPAEIRMLRLPCLGRINSGTVLKAFASGADGVLLLGCPPAECHFESGENIRESVTQSRQLLQLLGIGGKRLKFIEVPLGRDDIMAAQVNEFVKSIEGLVLCQK